GDLRRGVDHRRNGLVVHFAELAGDQVGDHHSFFFTLVREHWPAHKVADGPDVRRGGPALVIDGDEATLVDLHAGAVTEQIFGIRATANRYDDLVDLDALLAFGIGVFQLHAARTLVCASDLCAETDVEPELFEVFERFLRHCAICHRQKCLERFQHDDFGAQALPHTAKLQTDDAGADHAEALRHGVEFERAPGIDDLLAVERQTPELDRRGTGGEHDVLRSQLLFLAVLARELDA